MKKESLLDKYQKALKANDKISEKTKKKLHYSYINKLFWRIFLSTLLLLGLIIGNKITLSKKNFSLSEYTIEKNWNFLKMTTVFNKIFGNFIDINSDDMLSDSTLFDEITYQDNTNYIVNYQFSGVNNLASGVIIKIIKNNDQTYLVMIQTVDNYIYTYERLKSVDWGIYNYLEKGKVIGLASKVDDTYQHNLTIKKDGKYYEYFKQN